VSNVKDVSNRDYEMWCALMRINRGRWQVDAIHNGVDRDLILICPHGFDPSVGIYVEASGVTMWSGRYEDAIPHIGEAIFHPLWGLSTLLNNPFYPVNRGPSAPVPVANQYYNQHRQEVAASMQIGADTFNKDLAEQGQSVACATAVRVSTVLYNRWTHH
jgi:hypothetical protein